MYIRDERSFSRRLTQKRSVVYRDVGACEGICKEEVSVIGELAGDCDDLIGDEAFCFSEVIMVFIEEDIDHAGRVLQFHHPVPLSGISDLHHHADEDNVHIVVPAVFGNSADGHGAGVGLAGPQDG